MTYSIRAACGNCNWRGEVTLPKGEEVDFDTTVCQCCGCSALYTPVYVTRYDIDPKV